MPDATCLVGVLPRGSQPVASAETESTLEGMIDAWATTPLTRTITKFTHLRRMFGVTTAADG